MGFEWDTFVSESKKDRARAYHFNWFVPPLLIYAASVALDADIKYLIKATSIPESTVEEIPAYWKGVEYKVGGSRRYTDWTVTLLCDKKSNIRMLMEAWMSGINNVVGSIVNVSPKIYANPVQSSIFEMLNTQGESTLKLFLYGIWPKNIGPITLDHSSQDFAQFDVTFSYLYHVII
jgi:hypothetical protein